MADSLVPDAFKALPWDEGVVYSFLDDVLECLQRFNQTALTGTVFADEHSERREVNLPAVANCFEVAEAKGLQWQLRLRFWSWCGFKFHLARLRLVAR